MRQLGILLKLTATVALLWFVFSRVDLAELAAHVGLAQIALALAAGVAVLSLQAFLIALRLRLCARMLGHELSVGSAWTASQYAGFFSHTPLSFLGGDAMRVWHLSGGGVPLGDAAKAVFMDRVLGFLGMLAFGVASAPALREVIGDPRLWSALVASLAVGVAAALLFVALGRLRLRAEGRPWRAMAEFATVSRYLGADLPLAAKALLLALALTSLNVFAIWAIGLAYRAPLDLRTAFAGVPMAFLVAMIPISVAGWGLREGALVVLLGLFGVPAALALTLSVTYGIATLLAYAPAAALFLAARRRAPGYPSA